MHNRRERRILERMPDIWMTCHTALVHWCRSSRGSSFMSSRLRLREHYERDPRWKVPPRIRRYTEFGIEEVAF